MEIQYIKLLNTMLKDMENAPSIYKPTPFWSKAVNEITGEIRKKGIENFKSLISPITYFVPSYGYYLNPNAQEDFKKVLHNNFPNAPNLFTRIQRLFSGETFAYSDYRAFLASSSETPPYTDKLSETLTGKPWEQFEFDGRLFSRAFLNYLLGINFLKKHCETKKISRILEIGGGYGALGEILLGDPRNNHFYIDVDIPPVSLVATYYLQSIYSREKIGDYSVLKKKTILQIDDLEKHYSAAVLCPWQLPNLTGSIDLFINYISFQEMEPNVVQHYLEHVQRLSPRYILLRNLREGKQVAKSEYDIGVKQPVLGKDYDHFLPNYSLVASNTVPFGFETEDGFHSELRLYSLID